MTTALFLLRCKQLNFSLEELDELSFGQILDVFTEGGNDNYKYAKMATQDDFDRLQVTVWQVRAESKELQLN